MKLAVYLDEAHDDPDKSGAIFSSNNINHVCLRRAWCRHISDMPDNAIAILESVLKKHNLIPIMLHTDIGCVKPYDLSKEKQRLVRALQICKYLNCKSIRLGLCAQPSAKQHTLTENTMAWAATISQLSIDYNLLPIIETDQNSIGFCDDPAAIMLFLNKFRRFSLLYDPGLLVSRIKCNPYIKFWSLLKPRIGFFDIHDVKNKDSSKPAGMGDAQLDITMSDALSCKFNGWFCLEPGLGARHGSATTKEKTFLCALDAFKSLLQRIQLPKIL